MVLCMDLAHSCAWLATPDRLQRQGPHISMRQVRGLVKSGMITPARDQETTQTTFVISAKGQAEVRKIKERQAQSLTKSSVPIRAVAKEKLPKQRGRSKMLSSAVSIPHSRRDSLRQVVERARKSGSLIHEES